MRDSGMVGNPFDHGQGSSSSRTDAGPFDPPAFPDPVAAETGTAARPDTHAARHVYAALVAHGNATVQELLALPTELPEAHLKAALNHLATTGFVRRSPRRADAWEAQPPELALRSALLRLEERLDDELRSARTTMDKARELALAYHTHRRQADALGAEVIVGRRLVQREMARLAAASLRSVDSLLPHVPSQEHLQSSSVDDEAFLARGVRLRSLFPQAAAAEPHVQDWARRASTIGAAARISSRRLHRLVVIDRTVAITINARSRKPGEDSVAVVFQDPVAVELLSDLFDVYWAEATPLAGAPPGADLSPTERALLRHLRDGLTQASIGKELGISDRSVRGMIATLCARVGASSQFALGIEAARNDWLDATS